MALVLVTGLCLAADITAMSPYAKQAKVNTGNVLTARVPVNQVNGKVYVWRLKEDFEGSWLPAGWSLAGSADLWSQHPVSGYGVGSYSARANFYYISSGSQDLITATFPATVDGDSVKFDHAYATYSGQVDQLQISTSNDSGSNWSVLVTLDGGASGPLNTGGSTQSVFVPNASQWATKSYPVPVGTNAIKFTAISAYGNQLYLDNVAVGHEEILNHNLTMLSIDAPTGRVEPGVAQTPQVTIRNNGQNAENNFWVKYRIDDSTKAQVYYQEIQITSALNPATSLEVNFPDFIPVAGNYTTTAWVELAGDEFPGDDTLHQSFTVSFLGWHALTPTAPVAVQWPGGCTDGQKIWSVGGLVSGSAVTNVVQVYDPESNTWSQPTTLPVAVCRPSCAIINGKLYVIGGYNASLTSQPYTQIYNIAGNAWSSGTPPPSARGGCGGGVINGKMYIVGGGTSAYFPTDCPTWEYNPAADTTSGTPWTQMADCPRGSSGMTLGAPFWGAPGLDFIVVGGDYRGYDDYYIYSPSGGWDTLAPGPSDAGGKNPCLIWDNEHIYLFGGDPNGSWSSLSNKTYHYNLGTGAWENLNIPLNQAYEGMIGAIINQKLYSFSGGNGSGPISPSPFEWTYDLTVDIPDLVSTSPGDGQTGVRLKQPIVVVFNQPMDPDSVDWNIVPDPGNMNLSWNARHDTLTLSPDNAYSYGTTYTVNLTSATSAAGIPMPNLPRSFSFTTWQAPQVIQSQMETPGYGYGSQIYGDNPAYSCFMAEDINLAGCDSVKVTAVEVLGVGWNGHTWHPFDSLYVCFTTDSSDLPAWSQAILYDILLPGQFDELHHGTGSYDTLILYLDPPAELPNGKTWMMVAPYMNYSTKDGQWGWCANAANAFYSSQPAWRNPGGGFGYGTDWQRASVLGVQGDLVFRALGYKYTGVAGEPNGITKATFALMPNYPNPVHERTNFSFSLPRASDYTLRVYNVAGQAVKTFNGQGQAGPNTVAWNAAGVGAGVYFYQLNAGGQSATGKLVVVK